MRISIIIIKKSNSNSGQTSVILFFFFEKKSNLCWHFFLSLIEFLTFTRLRRNWCHNFITFYGQCIYNRAFKQQLLGNSRIENGFYHRFETQRTNNDLIIKDISFFLRFPSIFVWCVLRIHMKRFIISEQIQKLINLYLAP